MYTNNTVKGHGKNNNNPYITYPIKIIFTFIYIY